MAEIGRKIREAREMTGMTQEELARKLGYKGKSAIAKIETGANDIPISKVKDFAKALYTTPAFLMGWEDEEGDVRHYINDDTLALAQQLHDDKELRMMFDTVKNLSPDAMQYVKDTLLYLEKLQKRQ